MDGVVHGHEVQTAGGASRVCAPAEKKNSHVMIPMQENKRLLSQNDKNGVDQLRDLAIDEEAHPKSGGAVSPLCGRVATDSLLERHLDDHAKQVWDLIAKREGKGTIISK